MLPQCLRQSAAQLSLTAFLPAAVILSQVPGHAFAMHHTTMTQTNQENILETALYYHNVHGSQ